MMPDRRILRACAVLVIAMAALTAAKGGLERLGGGQLPQPTGGAPTDLLAALSVAAETGDAGYSRDRFGTGWSVGVDGCDTRSQVLRAESVTPTVAEGCTVVAGEWHSVYDAVVVVDPGQLDVDHLVPLAEAWASGAAGWTDQQRQAFANDTGRPDALIAVTAGSNRAKGDRDPAGWMPPDPSVHCRYAAAWATQKAAWDLTADPAEHRVLAAVLATCPAGQQAGGQP